MKTTFVTVSISSLVLAMALVGDAAGTASRKGSAAIDERDRIQRHLAGAERLVRRTREASFGQSQRRQRLLQVERLHEYAQRGVFPHNHDFAVQRKPYFVDRHGTLCAMAYLIAASGRHDIVSLVSKARNNATVIELSVDPVIGPILKAWLHDAGLSVAEAQRIQPAYDAVYSESEDPEISTSFAAASAALGSLSMVATAMNASVSSGAAPPRWASQVGLGVGTAAVILGGSNLDPGGARRALAVCDIAVGAAAVISSTWGLIYSRKVSRQASLPGEHRIAIAPTTRWIEHGPAIGLRMRF